MWGLLLTTIITSAADSLNPIAITQQFVLQAMVKRPRHILYFILPTGVTNLIGGFLVYYGAAELIGDFAARIINGYGRSIFTAELILGIIFLIATGLLLQRGRITMLQKRDGELESGGNISKTSQEERAAKKIKSVSPPALIALGVAATISELATALPYFAFLAVLLGYRLTLPHVTVILVVYNIIYMLPLIILFLIYLAARERFESLYGVMKRLVAKWSNVIAPLVTGIIGVCLIFHSVNMLLQ